MATTQEFNQPIIHSKRGKISRSWLGETIGKSAATTLIELGITLGRLGPEPSLVALCPQCHGYKDPQTSTAHFAHVFCSDECEQEFTRAALSSVTLQDCIRIQ